MNARCPGCAGPVERSVGVTLFDVNRPPPHMLYAHICARCAMRLRNNVTRQILARIRRAYRTPQQRVAA